MSLKLGLTEKQLARLPTNAKLMLLPYPFKDSRRVLALVPEDMVDQSLEWGAHVAGTTALIPELLDDTYEVDMDYDVLIAHSSLSKEITGRDANYTIVKTFFELIGCPQFKWQSLPSDLDFSC